MRRLIRRRSRTLGHGRALIRGSTNIFADLGFADAIERQVNLSLRTMESDQDGRSAISGALDNARELLTAARSLLDTGQPPRLAYHFAALALEGVGKVSPQPDAKEWTTKIAFPAAEWQDRDFNKQCYPQRITMPDGSEHERPMLWSMNSPRELELKNIGQVSIIEIGNPMRRLNSFSTEDRARLGVAALRTAGRYWPPA